MKRVLLGFLAFVLLIVAATAVWLYTPDLPREEVEALYLRDPGDYREIAGQRLHVRVEGEGPAVVLIHGFGSSLLTWDAWARDLATDHRVVRFDLPGHGLSGPAPDDDYGIDRSVALIGALLDALGLERATLVGNSLGGLAAWRFAAARPDRVEKLVLIAAGGFVPPGAAYGQRIEVPPAFRAMRSVLPESMVRASLASMYGDPARLDPETVRRYWTMMRAPGVRDALVRRLEDFTTEDPVPLLARIPAPTLVMWGARDVMVPATDAARFAGALPDARVVIWPDLGHVPMEEAPERTLADLRAFLAGVPVGPAPAAVPAP